MLQLHQGSIHKHVHARLWDKTKKRWWSIYYIWIVADLFTNPLFLVWQTRLILSFRESEDRNILLWYMLMALLHTFCKLMGWIMSSFSWFVSITSIDSSTDAWKNWGTKCPDESKNFENTTFQTLWKNGWAWMTIKSSHPEITNTGIVRTISVFEIL